VNIGGRPEELAKFIRCLNDEPTFDAPLELSPLGVVRPPTPQAQSNLSTSWLAIGVILAAGLAFLSTHI